MVIQWWASFLIGATPRQAISRNHIPDKIIYTNTAMAMMILAIIVSSKREFDDAGIISEAYYEVSPGEWVAFSSETNLIYGSELLAMAQTVADPGI